LDVILSFAKNLCPNRMMVFVKGELPDGYKRLVVDFCVNFYKTHNYS